MQRRHVLFGAAAASALVLGSARANAVGDGFFHWRKPGGNPYDREGRRLDSALAAFRDLYARDPDVEDELRRKVQQNSFTSALVFENWQVTRMLFGANQRVPNVIVNTSDLAAWRRASRKLKMYTAERATGGEARFYALFFPEVCGNWSMRLGRRVCILDQLVCDQGCTKLQAQQYQ